VQPNARPIAEKQAVRFGPRAIAVGHFIAYADVPGDTVDFLEEIDRRWEGEA
jgi:hypothetical protein